MTEHTPDEVGIALLNLLDIPIKKCRKVIIVIEAGELVKAYGTYEILELNKKGDDLELIEKRFTMVENKDG